MGQFRALSAYIVYPNLRLYVTLLERANSLGPEMEMQCVILRSYKKLYRQGNTAGTNCCKACHCVGDSNVRWLRLPIFSRIAVRKAVQLEDLTNSLLLFRTIEESKNLRFFHLYKGGTFISRHHAVPSANKANKLP